ncbi:DUF6612 family protein [Halalkalibacter sp. AB-rgal2]|uniref:DUF6612 family protein n=1 Tax=Halalkalibacter sp. AB-rgal2 TaxID=3242695 RepID=UPI00359EB5D2
MKKYLFFTFFLLITSACSEPNLNASEVWKRSIESMNNVTEYTFTLESQAEETDNLIATKYSEGSVQYDPLISYITVINEYDEDTRADAEVYITDETFFYKSSLQDEEEWEVRPLLETPISPYEQMSLVNEFSDLFSFNAEKDYYHFSLTASDEDFHSFALDIIPFFHISDSMTNELMLHLIREMGQIDRISYDFTINKETFKKTSATIELHINIGEDGTQNKMFVEQIHITYDYSKIEPILIPKTIKELPFEEKDVEDLLNKQDEYTEHQKGISDGNYFNGAHFTTDDDWIYFSDDFVVGDGVYRFKQADIDNQIEKIADVSASYLNVTDDWLYYQDPTDDFNVYRMKKDGSEIEKQIHYRIANLRVIDDVLYYKNFSEVGPPSLQQAQIDGSITTTFSLADNISRFTVHQGNAYYQTDNFQLYVTDLDPHSQSSHLFTVHLVGLFQIKDNYMYYQNRSDGHSIYRSPIDGHGIEKLLDAESQDFHVTDDSIFFTNASDDFALYKLDLETQELVKIDDSGFAIHIIEDLVFYQKPISSSELGWFVVNQDGTNIRRLHFE